MLDDISSILASLSHHFGGASPSYSSSTRKNVRCQNCGQKNIVWSDDPPEKRVCDSCGTTLKVRFGTPAPKLHREYAGFWIRLSAGLVDCILVIVFTLVFFFLLLFSGIFFPSESTWRLMVTSEQSPFLLFIIWPVLWVIYYWLWTGLKGQTLGKMLFRIKVVNSESKKPGLIRALLREIPGKLMSTLGFLIGFFWIAGDRQKQGWHDKIARTYVIKVMKTTSILNGGEVSNAK